MKEAPQEEHGQKQGEERGWRKRKKERRRKHENDPRLVKKTASEGEEERTSRSKGKAKGEGERKRHETEGDEDAKAKRISDTNRKDEITHRNEQTLNRTSNQQHKIGSTSGDRRREQSLRPMKD